MSECWPVGALRAQLDRELPPDEMDRVAAHLGECAECARLSRELATRAEWLGVWMNELPSPELDWRVAAPRRAAAGSRWIGLAAGLALAGLALAAWLLPRYRDVAIVAPPVVISAPPPVMAESPGNPQTMAVLPAKRAVLRGPARRPRARAQTVSDEFLALDDEPIETGVVMRVGVEPGNVQADIVFGQDGRAHAIRLVGTRN